MKIVQFKAQNFKRLQAVEINPDGDIITIGGENGEGKTSILDAIWVALAGKSVAPPKPIRNGQQECFIELDLGSIKITRTFRDKGEKVTEAVKVESAEGLRYTSPETMLKSLIGQIGFDPLEFAHMDPEDQADALLQIVPLSIDLEEFAEADASDYAKRRDVNRDIANLKARLESIAEQDLPEVIPDRDKLVEQLGNAADENARLDKERRRRQDMADEAEGYLANMRRCNQEALQLRARADALDSEAADFKANSEKLSSDLKSLPPLGDPVDTNALREKILEADQLAVAAERQGQRKEMATELEAKEKESSTFTSNMKERETQRRDALAEAPMPIEGLSFGINEKGRAVVEFKGVPFEQISTAEQIRASTAIAMAANPELRVLRIKDGAFLSPKSLAMVGEMAKDNDFQLWIEVVGEGEGVGFIMEDGLIRQKALTVGDPEAKEKTPRTPAKKAKAGDQGTLV